MPATPAPEELPEAFRRHFAEHNRQVILMAIVTGIFAIAAWAALYFFAHWLSLLAVSVIYGADASPPGWLAPRFLASGAALLGFALLFQLTHPHERAADRKRPWHVVIDILLAVPRATLSIWGTLSACHFLNERELHLAWNLMRRLDAQPYLALQEVPQEIPAPRDQRRILAALQWTELIHLERRGDVFYIRLRTAEARALCQPRMRFRINR